MGGAIITVGQIEKPKLVVELWAFGELVTENFVDLNCLGGPAPELLVEPGAERRAVRLVGREHREDGAIAGAGAAEVEFGQFHVHPRRHQFRPAFAGPPQRGACAEVRSIGRGRGAGRAAGLAP